MPDNFQQLLIRTSTVVESAYDELGVALSELQTAIDELKAESENESDDRPNTVTE
jgi:hypothetical protein